MISYFVDEIDFVQCFALNF